MKSINQSQPPGSGRSVTSAALGVKEDPKIKGSLGSPVRCHLRVKAKRVLVIQFSGREFADHV